MGNRSHYGQESMAEDNACGRERWVVTGAGSGIGHGIVTRLVGEQVQVTACVHSEEELASLCTKQNTEGDELSISVFDVRDVQRGHEVAAASNEPVDVLVACAGVFGGQHSVRDLDFAEALDTFSINTLGPLRTVQAFLPRLLRGHNPRIALISSVYGSMTMEGASNTSNIAYRASKAALNKVIQGLATDLKRDGITVIALEPGWVRTPIGGPDAPLSVDESVSGIIESLRALTINQSGNFLNYQLQEVPW